ncbi:anaphase-promoting complex, subunit 10-domain-containing protein [Dioszegia hungarica]|uniref:Anaphase-promoting complex, subunit 10-domain-containing protein n=1 Tax=Dioszegia hungarica TaxID=4972 RepID=A0AA38HB01_9TREE|nr:anaphase-promoting complex, subunit 10-domain-containing protein [Dioszegia hungarica]KAI9636740.1 anaphase-promoting complex, subunit 10-domain-containing protein [Dioszegia hungarica]
MSSRSASSERPELGHLARWTVSSHKYGFGVDNLKDDNEGTFWQSEGPQPHVVDLSFPKRVFISAVSILTSHPKDDSYTPSKISVRCGTSVHDLQEVRLGVFDKPDGWQYMPLRPEDADGEEIEGPPIPAHHLRIVILANHLNGKDTHVRGVRVFGADTSIKPSTDAGDSARMSINVASPGEEDGEGGEVGEGKRLLMLGHDGLSGFTSRAFRMHEGIR